MDGDIKGDSIELNTSSINPGGGGGAKEHPKRRREQVSTRRVPSGAEEAEGEDGEDECGVPAFVPGVSSAKHS